MLGEQIAHHTKLHLETFINRLIFIVSFSTCAISHILDKTMTISTNVILVNFKTNIASRRSKY